MSRALALLASFASPIFMVAALAGWLYKLWPATPTTLAIAAFAVVAGPLLSQVHVATAREETESVPAPATEALPPITLTARAANARAFCKWRDSSHPAIARRERERRASRWIRA